MMPKSKNPVENFIVNLLAYGLIALILGGFALMIINGIIENVIPWVQSRLTFGPTIK